MLLADIRLGALRVSPTRGCPRPAGCHPGQVPTHTSSVTPATVGVAQDSAYKRAARPVRARAAAGSARAGPVAQPAALLAQVDDFATDSRPVILFDGVCNLCNGGVNLMLDLDQEGKFRFAALQSAAGRRLLQRCGRRADDISSIVLVERDLYYIRSDAVLHISARLQVPLPLLAALGFPVPRQVRDTLYDLVADNRYHLLGRQDTCRVSTPGLQARFLVD